MIADAHDHSPADAPRADPARERPRAQPWQRMAAGGGLLDPSGALRSTVFEEMTALATRTGSVNLGQGFPDFAPPQPMVDAAVAALHTGHHQYAPIIGVPALRARQGRAKPHFCQMRFRPLIGLAPPHASAVQGTG